MNLSLFQKIITNSLKYFFYFLLLFFLNRLFFLLVYGKNILLNEPIYDILLAFFVGVRFDISAICYAFLPLALGWLVSLFIPERNSIKFQNIYSNISKFYLLFVSFVFVSLFITDFFFYQFFQSHINILFFGIFKDDTQAVLQSVWTDYPILKIILMYIVSFFIFIFIHKKSCDLPILKKKYALLLLTIFPLFIIGMRGSIGVFTLRREHTNVCVNEFINSLCYNPIYALKFAHSELKDNHINPDIQNELKNNGFKDIHQVYSQYQGQNSSYFDANGYATTPNNEFLAQNPPNVVFVLMESMSNHYFELHSEKLNLLGDLKALLPELYYFKNGLSSFDGTIYSLENLLVNTPKGIISQSPYFDTSFSSSVANPFKAQGYQTAFITGAHTSWRNIDNFIKNQNFDIIEGNSHIQKKYPKAETFAWGTHDQHLFEYITEFLKTPSKKPKFIFSLTVSNHTPYEIPTHYTPYPISLEEIKDQLRVDEKTALDNFYSHQYAASQLAKFINNIKNSPLGENTIIIATGDHNIRQIFEYNSEKFFLKNSVPILFYIPEKYKPQFFNPNIMVSHKDIFPTIFNLSLSNQKYIYSGDDMFKNTTKHRFAVYGYSTIADSIGLVTTENTPLYYTWKDKEKRTLETNNIASPHAQTLLNKLKSFSTLQTITIYQDIEHYKKFKK